ncbi:MAG: YidC/Oxa1 family membrane protein insertase, partial [Acidimicrobiales bacterium]
MLHAINHLLGPLYSALAAVLAFWYGVVPSYGIAIALFTVTVMVVLAPLTIKSTRSMLAMQGLQPEMNKIRAKYKGDRQAMNEELMALYKDAGVSPAGGCLPMFIQLPVFWVLYEVILGLQHTVKVHGIPHPQPRYISTHSLLYQHLIHSFHGTAHMPFWGIDLAKSATSSHASFAAAIPYYVLLAICIGLQYLQMRQLTSRNPQQQTGTAKQMQAMQKFMPLVFGIIYIAIPAGVNIYFLVSSLFRIGQQEVMYRYDPQVKRHLADNKRRQEPAETTERGTKDRSPAPRRAGGEDAPVAGAG